MRKKILFYGNCQVGVVARHFRTILSDKFDVQICRDCGLVPFWGEPGLFAVWSQENKKRQEEYKDCVRSKIREADIFVFQDHSRSAIEELRTKSLHDDVARGLKVCLPDTRFFAHLTDAKMLGPYIQYIKEKESDPREIIKYLQESDDPQLVSILKNDYPFNKNHLKYRNENISRRDEEAGLYDHRIDMCDYLEGEFEKKLLSVSHNHMNRCYFIELIYRVYDIIGVERLDYPVETLEFPGHDSLDPRQFRFFSEMFPELDYGRFKGRRMVVEDVL